MSQHVLFIGAGQANLSVLKNWQKNAPKNAEWTLISPSRYQYYTGMFSRFMEGRCELEDIRIDLKDFCQKHEGRFIEEKVTAVDKNRKFVLTENGKSVSYDLLSANIGSQHVDGSTPGVREHALFLKPNEEFPTVAASMQHTEYPVIAGGGITGVELALSLQAWRQANHKKTPVTLITEESILPEEKKEVREKMRTLLDERGLLVYENTPVESIDADVVYAGSEVIPYGEVLWAAGPEPPLIFDYANLPVDETGFLLVSSTLQSIHEPSIFGSGDGVTIDEYPDLPKNGVIVVQEAKVLETNIYRKLQEKKLKAFNPPKKYRQIVNIGRKQGLYLHGSQYNIGKRAWKIKKRTDKKFMKQFE
ncbi:NAD(P)/FAD-dependent oxidoreductase [Salibacterium aidingense]|uniref:NAD(P)/FAD-dependent oxidoreductase n=1 Tax=Salibacterium aidingense TaxID=384933 RepID=UPI00042181DB|nr:FAD-dependent oxidoreductase [Salibacterium aidingense]